jgi:FKBP-type peptidyl-prolyl cis-trans isomerase FkpA
MGTGTVTGLGFTVVKEGAGPSPKKDDVGLISYVGKLEDGKVFDQAEQAPLPVAGLVPGFTEALLKMKKGGSYHISIPPRLGYGDKAAGPIPANSTLEFDVKLLDFKSKAEIERLQREMQNLRLEDAQGKLPPGMGPEVPRDHRVDVAIAPRFVAPRGEGGGIHAAASHTSSPRT